METSSVKDWVSGRSHQRVLEILCQARCVTNRYCLQFPPHFAMFRHIPPKAQPMNPPTTRRAFLKSSVMAGAGSGLAMAGLIPGLPFVSAAEVVPGPDVVRFSPDLEPLVRLLEDTSRERVLGEVATRVKAGLPYPQLLAAILLAGMRNIQPRPVGFKFHAVLVVNSAHLASMNSPDHERWLPIFWAVDQFKSSQARDVREGDWTMGAVDESKVPPAHRARAAFIEAMDNWDEAASDAAACSMARHLGAQECFELFARYGARDFRDIAHKAIYVANTFRTLQTIGWRHAEPVLRALAYGLLDRGRDGNPARGDFAADRPFRRNAELVSQIKTGWSTGKDDPAAMQELLTTLREGGDADASRKVVELLNRGASPKSLTDAFLPFAGELLMRNPGIQSLHSVTSSNALHYAFQNCATDETRRLLLLQNAAFLVLFRNNVLGAGKTAKPLIDQFEPLTPEATGEAAVEEIFADVSRNKMVAAQKALAWLQTSGQVRPFMDAAQRLIYLKGNDSHDYKFSSAVLEDYFHVSPAVRDRFLAASVFYLKGSRAPDTDLSKRIRDAIG